MGKDADKPGTEPTNSSSETERIEPPSLEALEAHLRHTHYYRLGGEKVLQKIIHDFVDHMVDDVMIGYLFQNVDRERLKEMEFQFTARFLGAIQIPYEGKGMRAAHQPKHITGGQFNRRRQILKETLEVHQVNPEIISDWLSHVDRMRALIVKAPVGECV